MAIFDETLLMAAKATVLLIIGAALLLITMNVIGSTTSFVDDLFNQIPG